MRLKAQLLHVADVYADALGCTEGAVSARVFRSGDKLRRLREGCDMLSGNIEDALQRLSDQWPSGVAWPSEVSRPAPRPPAPSVDGGRTRRRTRPPAPAEASDAPAGPPT